MTGWQVPRTGAGSGFFGTVTGMGSSRTLFLGTLGTSKILVYFSFVGTTDAYETIRQSYMHAVIWESAVFTFGQQLCFASNNDQGVKDVTQEMGILCLVSVSESRWKCRKHMLSF